MYSYFSPFSQHKNKMTISPYWLIVHQKSLMGGQISLFFERIHNKLPFILTYLAELQRHQTGLKCCWVSFGEHIVVFC